MMDQEAEFDSMNYTELRREAKRCGVKGNLKADKLRKELKRVSMLITYPTTCDDDDDVDKDDDVENEEVDESIRNPLALPTLPTKTPAHVTRRKHSRVPFKARNDALDNAREDPSERKTDSPRNSTIVGVADKTLADPLGLPDDVRQAYISEDEDSDDLKPKAVNVSAFLSEGEGEEEEDVNDGGVDAKSQRNGMEKDQNDPPKLERQKTFEMDSPSTNVRPPLARQRTFERESPSTNVRPPLARQRTFELDPAEGNSGSSSRRRTFEKDEIASADSVGSRTRRRTVDKTEIAAAVDGTETDTVFGLGIPSVEYSSPLPKEFSILDDETSGLTESELKARILASIAVTPATALAGGSTTSSSKMRSNDDENQGKSCSKDWKKIHSTNDKGMESLVDFYERKKKRVEETQKSTQKSAAKIAAVATAKKEATTGKSARALAFGKDLSAASTLGKLDESPCAKNNPTKSILPSKSAIPSLGKAPAKRPAANIAEKKFEPMAKKMKTITSGNNEPTTSNTRAISGSAALSAATRSLKRARASISSPIAATTLAAQSLKRAKLAIASPSASSKVVSKAKDVPSSKRMKTSNDTVAALSLATKGVSKPAPFVPAVFSTKNMSLNFGGVGVAATKQQNIPRADVQPIVKNMAGGSNGQKLGPSNKMPSSVTKAKIPTTLLPSMKKLGGDRRVSPRVNKSVAMTTPTSSSTASTSLSTPMSGIKKTTPLSRLAPSRVTTPGKSSACTTPASASRIRKTPGTTPVSASRMRKTPQSQQKAPWIPAGVTAAPKFNFGAPESGENVFKFTAAGSMATAHQLHQQQQSTKKKFDLKESLKQKLKYKPHRGPMRAFDEGKAKASALNKKQNRRL